jgi:diguanylate cyclase (GGDEF)-like protein
MEFLPPTLHVAAGAWLEGLTPASPAAVLTALALALAALLCSLALLLWQRLHSGRLQRRLAETQHRLETLQGRDPVTGALTRPGFDKVLAAAVGRADREGLRLCVLVLGLDHFRAVNDAFGLAVGDEVLKRVCGRLVEVLPGVPLARLGGDEFALLLPGELAASRTACNRVLQAVQRPMVCGGHEFRVGSSLGVATYPEHGSMTMMLPNASAAMRVAKEAGGSLHAEYQPSMGSLMRRQAELLHDLRLAVDRRQFELVYQPKVDARSLQVTAAEALLRWHHPQRGLITPDLFIPLAERHGLIATIGQWVLEEACRQAAVWREQGLRMRVAINLSGVQLRQDDLAPRLQAALDRHGLQPGRFTVEITETAAMENTAVTRRALARLGKLGVHMSIDDFGVGESSLAALRRLPAAELKIDRAFVTDLEARSDARSIVQAIVQMAHSLEMRVVAEGVETEAQRDLLVGMGCDELQGYLFARPMTATALSLWAAGDSGDDDTHAEFRASLFNETAPAPLGE